ncbi:uncharacterized protein [Periplaneta americana]|uniref:uncharacterized protein n=1 Tax=Periplaneta americana TaxID=6978 RepID=UPI0037E86B83
MKNLCLAICVLGAIVQLTTATDTSEKSFVLRVTEVKEVSNEKYVKISGTSVNNNECGYKTNFTIVQTMSDDVICETTFFRQTDEGFEQCPLSIAPQPCCEALKNNIIYKQVLENQNFPPECPVPPGNYFIENSIANTSNISKDIPRGNYRAVFSVKQNETMIYMLELNWKIEDKTIQNQ